MQMQTRFTDRLITALKNAVPIAEIHFFSGVQMHFSLGRNGFDRHDDGFHLAVVGTCVHKDRAAHAPGNPTGKLQPRETILLCKHGSIPQQCPRPNDEIRSLA